MGEVIRGREKKCKRKQTYTTAEGINLDHLKDKSKNCKWAAAFIMEIPAKSSCPYLQKKTYITCFDISTNAFALLYNTLYFPLSEETIFRSTTT